MRFDLVAPAALSFVIVAAAPAAEAASVAEWRAALDEIAADIRATHPDPFTRVGELAFMQAFDQLRSDLPRLGEEERVVRAMQLLALIGDGHTYLEPRGEAFHSWYPIRLYEFSDGYFVTSAHRAVADLAGAEVLEIAGRPASEVIDAARSLLGAENVFLRRERLYPVHNAALMRGLGYAEEDGRLRVRLRLRTGRVVERRLLPQRTDNPAFLAADSLFEWVYRAEVYGLPFGENSDWIAAFGQTPSDAFLTADESRPPFMGQRSRFYARALPEADAYYMQLNQTDDTTMISFVQEHLAIVDRLRPGRLILDLRFNFGGDGSRVADMTHQFVRREADPPWRELYVLTGRKNYSAAIMALDALADNVVLTIVGEPAGGGLNTYGDPVSRLYEDANLRLYVSSLRHQLGASNDRRDILPVDAPAIMSFAEYASGRDPAVDAILAGQEMRSIPLIVRRHGGAAARSVYRDRLARFGHLDWWSAPPEIEMRRACDHLVAAQRLEEALDACALTTEMHPFIWNSWYNLGLTQRAAGQMQERLSSYRCVLELEPTNFNGPGLRRAIAEAEVTPPLPAGCPVERR